MIVKQVSLKNVNILKATLLEQLGEAQLKNEDSSLLIYRSDKFDFKFASNGSTIEQIFISDMLK